MKKILLTLLFGVTFILLQEGGYVKITHNYPWDSMITCKSDTEAGIQFFSQDAILNEEFFDFNMDLMEDFCG